MVKMVNFLGSMLV
ncbi:hypothetical protein LINPERHAP1_LOCUS8467 [Linum perenne]